MYDVLAMIWQLGLPTWFLTLSAAGMQWPDVIQTIARQYGTIFTDKDSMSFKEISKWLRKNPVTAAWHFHYRLNCFFQMFIKSKAHPVGELPWTMLFEEIDLCMSNSNLMIHEIVKSMLCILNRTHWRLHNLILSSCRVKVDN